MIYRSYYLWKFEASSLFWFLSCWRIVSDFLNSCFLWSMWFLNLWISTSSNSWVFGMLIEVFWCLIHKCEKCYFEGLTWILQNGWKTLSDLCSFWKNSRSLNECYQFVIASPQVPSMDQSMMNTNSSTLSLHVSLSIWSQHFEDWINFQVRQACWLEQCWQRWIMNKVANIHVHQDVDASVSLTHSCQAFQNKQTLSSWISVPPWSHHETYQSHHPK